jgi:hypothetical protein
MCVMRLSHFPPLLQRCQLRAPLTNKAVAAAEVTSRNSFIGRGVSGDEEVNKEIRARRESGRDSEHAVVQSWNDRGGGCRSEELYSERGTAERWDRQRLSKLTDSFEETLG